MARCLKIFQEMSRICISYQGLTSFDSLGESFFAEDSQLLALIEILTILFLDQIVSAIEIYNVLLNPSDDPAIYSPPHKVEKLANFSKVKIKI